MLSNQTQAGAAPRDQTLPLKGIKVMELSTTTDFEVRNQADSLGHHTDEIDAGIGYSAAAIEKLKAAGAVLASDRILNIGRNDA